MIDPWGFVVYALAVWRVAFLLVYDRGPWDFFLRLRGHFGVIHDEADGTPISWPSGSIFACLGCMAVWIAPAIWFLPQWALVMLAAAGAAKLIQGWYER